METYCASCKKYTTNENSCVGKTKQNKLKLLSNCAVCGRKKNRFLLKTKNSKTLKMYQMNFLKWVKSLTNFYWLETNLCQKCIKNSQDLLILLVDYLLDIAKELNNLEKQEKQHLYRN